MRCDAKFLSQFTIMEGCTIWSVTGFLHRQRFSPNHPSELAARLLWWYRSLPRCFGREIASPPAAGRTSLASPCACEPWAPSGSRRRSWSRTLWLTPLACGPLQHGTSASPCCRESPARSHRQAFTQSTLVCYNAPLSDVFHCSPGATKTLPCRTRCRARRAVWGLELLEW